MNINCNDIGNLQQDIINDINNKQDLYIKVSHDIHANPQIGNEEYFASELLENILFKEGFSLEKSLFGHPTSFIARKKSAKSGPTIGFLAEYDALPKIGHACGHNIIGTSSVAAAIAISNLINKIGGEIVVLGTPAEEGGINGSAKATFVKNDVFKDIDTCLIVHPWNKNSVTGKCLALDPIDFEFFGKSAHAAAAPEEGINALNAVIELFNGINALRQHLTNDIKIHGIITNGGDAPNIVPEYAKAKFFIRAETRKSCNETTQKVINIAKGAALITGAKLKTTFFQNQIDDFLINRTLDMIFVKNAKLIGLNMETSLGYGLGSTDAGNVSYVTPTIQPYLKIGNNNLAPHTTEFCDAAISKEGDEALINAAKILALTALTLITDKDKLNAVKEDFKNNAK
ncbi:M20 family metallopeptidase [Clostridium guangxiense]|uniref:M20 family metallopeptidase n=2 Tax=Clostridium TaxID=1485 RepID=UPI001E40CCCF|nr:M20 family metallopeptidase [Clostridium guangxiense]MCD2348913.1 M20 family metallopeptidase [Clostridium guangxiense]